MSIVIHLYDRAFAKRDRRQAAVPVDQSVFAETATLIDQVLELTRGHAQTDFPAVRLC